MLSMWHDEGHAMYFVVEVTQIHIVLLLSISRVSAASPDDQLRTFYDTNIRLFKRVRWLVRLIVRADKAPRSPRPRGGCFFSVAATFHVYLDIWRSGSDR